MLTTSFIIAAVFFLVSIIGIIVLMRDHEPEAAFIFTILTILFAIQGGFILAELIDKKVNKTAATVEMVNSADHMMLRWYREGKITESTYMEYINSNTGDE